MPLLLFSCTGKNREKVTGSGKSDTTVSGSEPLLFLSGTNDRMVMDTMRYLMDITPLSYYKSYKKMYDPAYTCSVDPPVPSTVAGKMDKYYSAQWVLLGDSLYLYAIDYVREACDKRRSHELDRLAEKMIGRKFSGDARIKGLPLDSLSTGTIAARWFSGDIRIKLPIGTNPFDQPDVVAMLNGDRQWAESPFWKLTFENGRLVSKKRIDPVAEGKKIKAAQQMKRENHPNPVRFFQSRTNDRLYMDSTSYLLDASPLAFFAGYEDIFRPDTIRPVALPIPGIEGFSDKFYSAQWVLWGDSLYLYAVGYDRQVEMASAPRKLERLVEELAGRKFVRDARTENLPSGSASGGVIAASWFSKSLYAKAPRKNVPAPKSFFDVPSGENWNLLPFWKLTFEHGKLVSKERLDPPR